MYLLKQLLIKKMNDAEKNNLIESEYTFFTFNLYQKPGAFKIFALHYKCTSKTDRWTISI